MAIDHDFQHDNNGVGCSVCGRPWIEHRSRIVSADALVDRELVGAHRRRIQREWTMTDAAHELVRTLRAFDNDEQVRIVNIALELARRNDVIDRESFHRAAQELADDCATTLGEAKSRAVFFTRTCGCTVPAGTTCPHFIGAPMNRRSTSPDGVLTLGELDDIRTQVARYSSDSVWRKLLAAFDAERAKTAKEPK